MDRISLGLSLVVGVGLASCVIPPQSQAPSQPLPWGPAPGASASASTSAQPAYAQPAYATPASAEAAPAGTCESACGHVAACELIPYDTCLANCGDLSAEQLASIASTSCEDLAAYAQAPSTEASTTPTYTETIVNDAPSTQLAGRWVSTEWASYTNAGMVSADFYLSITVGDDGRFHGSWGPYVCLTQTYGVWSCGFNRIEGDASGRLAADGTGEITLERVGRTSLVWSATSSEIKIEMPRNWQGENILFRSSVKR